MYIAKIERDADGKPRRMVLMSTPTVADEIKSRQSRNERVKALFLSRPARWISVKELAKHGGWCAWRTRVSEVRVQLEKDDAGTIQWNGDPSDSRYRYLKQRPLGPDAAVPRERKLF